MAVMTCEGSIEPAEQAEPLEAHTPSRSSAASKAMLSAPATVKATVFARQRVVGERRVTPGREPQRGLQELRAESCRAIARVEDRSGHEAGEGLGKAGNGGEVLGAGAAFVFVGAAELDGVGQQR